MYLIHNTKKSLVTHWALFCYLYLILFHVMCNHTKTYLSALNRIILSFSILICTGDFGGLHNDAHNLTTVFTDTHIIWTISTYKKLRCKHSHLKVTMFKETPLYICWSYHDLTRGFVRAVYLLTVTGGRRVLACPAFLC